MRRTLSKALLLLFASAAVAADTGPVPPDPSEHLGIEMTIRPVDERPGFFLATATVTDLDTDRVVGTPRLLFSAAEEATIETGVAGRWLLHVGVSADPAARVATYEARFTRDGKVTSRQRVAVRLNG